MHKETEESLHDIIRGIHSVRQEIPETRFLKPVHDLLVEIEYDLSKVLLREKELERGETNEGREGSGVHPSGGTTAGVPVDGVAEADSTKDSVE